MQSMYADWELKSEISACFLYDPFTSLRLYIFVQIYLIT